MTEEACWLEAKKTLENCVSKKRIRRIYLDLTIKRASVKRPAKEGRKAYCKRWQGVCHSFQRRC